MYSKNGDIRKEEKFQINNKRSNLKNKGEKDQINTKQAGGRR